MLYQSTKYFYPPSNNVRFCCNFLVLIVAVAGEWIGSICGAGWGLIHEPKSTKATAYQHLAKDMILSEVSSRNRRLLRGMGVDQTNNKRGKKERALFYDLLHR